MPGPTAIQTVEVETSGEPSPEPVSTTPVETEPTPTPPAGPTPTPTPTPPAEPTPTPTPAAEPSPTRTVDRQWVISSRGETSALYESAFAGDFDTVYSLLVQGADVNDANAAVQYPPNPRIRKSFTALHLAAVSNPNPEVLSLLLDAGANIEARTELGRTPLRLAAQFNTTEVVEFLLDAGADSDARSDTGSTVLHLAVLSQNPALVALVLERGGNKDINATNNSGSTPLHYAVGYRGTDVVSLLLNNGADNDLNTITRRGHSPLHIAVLSKDNDVIRLIGERGGGQAIDRSAIEIRLTWRDGTYRFAGSPLRFAAWWWRNSPETDSLLFDLGADIDSSENSEGFTPLHVAAADNNFELAGLLMDRGADVNAKNSWATRLCISRWGSGGRRIWSGSCWTGAPTQLRPTTMGKRRARMAEITAAILSRTLRLLNGYAPNRKGLRQSAASVGVNRRSR